jgi:predicted DNA binding protein
MIVEFDIDSDVLSHALQRTDGMVVVVDRLKGSDVIPLRNLFWASGGDFERFEAALGDDPTITDFDCLVEDDDARLYRVQYSEDVPEVEAYRAAVELDGTVLHAENDGGGWLVRMRFPDRDSVSRFCDRCWAADFDLRIRAVYDQHGGVPKSRYGLTTLQYETLVRALELDYFSIPRGAALEDVADELGVSSQAASERLRRGMKTLVTNTLDTLEDDHPIDPSLEATE